MVYVRYRYGFDKDNVKASQRQVKALNDKILYHKARILEFEVELEAVRASLSDSKY